MDEQYPIISMGVNDILQSSEPNSSPTQLTSKD